MLIKSRKRPLGLLCAFLATMCWASNYPVSRFLFNSSGAQQPDEWWTAWLRVVLGILVFLPVTFTEKEGSWGLFRQEWKKDWKMFFFLSLCIVSESVFCFVAMKYTTGARASLMANTSPVFTLLISVLAAKEVLNRRKLTGMLVGLAGIVLAAVSRGGDMFSVGVSMFKGDLLALISGIFWALFTVFGGVISSRYNGAFCITLYRLGGLVLMLPVLWIFDSKITFDMPFTVWGSLIYLSVVSGGVAVWLWSIGQKYVEPGVLGAFGYLSAFCAALFSLVFLKERLTFNFILAFCLVLSGMILMIKPKTRSEEEDGKPSAQQ